MDTRSGATTSAAGGTLYSYNVNHITWTCAEVCGALRGNEKRTLPPSNLKIERHLAKCIRRI